MLNLTAFVGYFLSYLIVFLVFVGLVVLGCFIGIKIRKSQDKKAAIEDSND